MKNVVVRKSSIHERGVFAARNFTPGECILAIDDSYVVTDTGKLTKRQRQWCDYLENRKRVLLQRPERYTNHSCTPNSSTRTVRGMRRVFATRSISQGEEITGDYAINGYGGTPEKCGSGSRRCRKILLSDFFQLPRELQRRYFPYLDAWLRKQCRSQLQQLQL